MAKVFLQKLTNDFEDNVQLHSAVAAECVIRLNYNNYSGVSQ